MRTSRILPAAPRATALLLLAGASALLAACEVVGSDKSKRDTSTVTAAPAGTAADSTTAGAGSAGGVPAAPSDSLASTVARDSGTVTLSTDHPVRGGVLFALAQGVASDIPRCSWKGAPLPCYRASQGVLAIVPLPADEPAGTFTLTFDRPGGRITRQITVADHDFGRELVFLDSAKYALVKRGADVARDARAVRGILNAESDTRFWGGSWGQPVRGARGGGYGAERFYYRAVDSARAIRLGPELKTRGSFGTDTIAAAAGDVPSWRHAGVDLAAAKGTSVVAPAAGLVADVGDYVLTGHTVIIDHGQGVHSAYFHLDTAFVQRGDRVTAGKRIGRVGSTGLATGPHLHYGIYVHGKDVDPAAWAAMPAFARDQGGAGTSNSQ